MRLLLVEDDLVYTAHLLRRIEQFGNNVHVDAASSLSGAMDAIHRGAAYRALLIDVCLGPTPDDRSGLDLIRQARAAGCHAPAILMSGLLEAELGPIALAAGAVASVPKFHTAALYATLELWTSDKWDEADVESVPDTLRQAVRLAQIAQRRRMKGSALEEAFTAHALSQLAYTALACDSSPDGNPMRACARAVSLERNTLSEYTPLARWSLVQITDALEARNARGERLTVSHLLALARLPASAVPGFTNRTLTESLTVREVREAVAERLGRAVGRRV